jgi:hypothetical protein
MLPHLKYPIAEVEDLAAVPGRIGRILGRFSPPRPLGATKAIGGDSAARTPVQAMAEGSAMSSTEKIAIGSILVGLIVLALKTFAWWLTGSVALMSDAMESIVNVATAVAALIAIRIAARPADRDHPYGHHKAEFFSAVLEGVMIIVAALLILREAWQAFQAPACWTRRLRGCWSTALPAC